MAADLFQPPRSLRLADARRLFKTEQRLDCIVSVAKHETLIRVYKTVEKFRLIDERLGNRESNVLEESENNGWQSMALSLMDEIISSLSLMDFFGNFCTMYTKYPNCILFCEKGRRRRSEINRSN